MDDRWPEIQASLRIEEVLEELGIHSTVVRGDEWFAHCPLPSHGGLDNNPSFSVNTDKMLFSCFTCGVGGTPVKLVMHVLDVDYEAALGWLAEFSDYTVHSDEGFLDQVRRKLQIVPERTLRSDDTVLPWYPLSNVEKWNKALLETDMFDDEGYLHLDGRNRYITREVVSHLRIGLDRQHSRGSHTGPALIIPAMVGDQCVGWQERWLGDRPSWVPKYTNTTDFPRGSVVYNRMVCDRPIVVVESPLTVARLLSLGIPAVATFGAKVSAGQLKILKTYRELWLSYDNDRAGRRAVSSLIGALQYHSDLWVIEPQASWGDKGDLGDVSDSVVLESLGSRVSAIAHSAAP